MEISNPMMSFNSNFLGLVTEQMVHQIFGNLVTIKRWTELWFVEALNRYLGAYVENPTMRGYEARSEITEDMMYVFNLDSLENAHAVSRPTWKILTVAI